jgi:hypothetical protein
MKTARPGTLAKRLTVLTNMSVDWVTNACADMVDIHDAP